MALSRWMPIAAPMLSLTAALMLLLACGSVRLANPSALDLVERRTEAQDRSVAQQPLIDRAKTYDSCDDAVAAGRQRAVALERRETVLKEAAFVAAVRQDCPAEVDGEMYALLQDMLDLQDWAEQEYRACIQAHDPLAEQPSPGPRPAFDMVPQDEPGE